MVYVPARCIMFTLVTVLILLEFFLAISMNLCTQVYGKLFPTMFKFSFFFSAYSGGVSREG